MKTLCLFFSCLLATFVFAEGEKKPEAGKPPAKSDFASIFSNAWLRCATDKAPVAYNAGDDVKFRFWLAGVTNDIPAGKLKLKLSRKGADGAEDSVDAPFEKKTYEYTTKIAQAGFVRLDAIVIGEDGKPLLAPSGKSKREMSLFCGAGAELESLKAEGVQSKEFARHFKELDHAVARLDFRKIARTERPAPDFKEHKVYTISAPIGKDIRPLTGLLILPSALKPGDKVPFRIDFNACSLDKEQPLPHKSALKPDWGLFVMPFEFKQERDDAYCSDLLFHVMSALKYIKTQPEWDGKGLRANGWCSAATLAIWAGGCGAGVNHVECGLIVDDYPGDYAASLFAKRIPPTCRVEVLRVALGDDKFTPADSARVWNSLDCDKTMNWVQGSKEWKTPPYYKERDYLWEKIRPVSYRNMDVEHVEPFGDSQHLAFKDIAVALHNKIVVQAMIDIDKPEKFEGGNLKKVKEYAYEGLVPLEMYGVIPKKRIKDKAWEKFKEAQVKLGAGSLGFPIYLDAGLELPEPPELPWIYIVDYLGIVRYSGPDFKKVSGVVHHLAGKMPKADPVFSYASPKLLKGDVEKLQKSKLAGSKIYKAIESKKKMSKPGSPIAAEAEELLLGMKQAAYFRLNKAKRTFISRPGLSNCELQDFLKEWPEYELDPLAKSLTASINSHKDVDKLAKLERELGKLIAWNPEKPADIKKKDKAVDEFRKKVDRFTKSKDPLLQGEAMSILQDLDNPPQPQAAAE